MNILHTFTRRALKKNRMRTLVTIIGIVLSMALLTAVIEGAYSGLVYMRNVIAEDSGNYHAYFTGLDAEQTTRVKDQGFVKDVVASWQTVGYEARSSNTERQPIYVDTLNGDAPLIETRIIKGRMPENEHEIILSSAFYNFASRSDLETFEVGNTVTLPIGTRVDPDGTPLTEYDPLWEEQSVIDAHEMTYTIVGIYKSFDASVGGNGFRALTKGPGTGDSTVFFTVRHPYLFKSTMRNQTFSGQWRSNVSLMRLYGVFGSDTLTTVLYGFAAILVVLVMFGSISLIYNAFSISVSERTRQFGILKSIGATKKQIRASVRYEALVLSAIGIPVGLIVGCVGIGITLFAIRDTFTKLMPNTGVQMRLVLHPVALLIAAVIALLTVLISAAVPARRAARLSPIEAIRQSTDVRIRTKEVRTSKLTEKLFGFEGAMGAKNFKRNKKSYRATVLSLFMSIVLFISASSFCTYLTDMVKTVSNSTNVDVFVQVPTDAAADMMQRLKAIEGVTRSAYYRSDYGDINGFTADPTLLSDAFKAVPSHGGYSENGQSYVPIDVLYLDDDSFTELCRASGVDPAPYFAEDCEYGVLMNTDITEAVYESSGTRRYRYDLFRSDALPASVNTQKIREREGTVWAYVWDDEVQETKVAYYPEAYAEQVQEEQGERYTDALDPKMAERIVSVEDACETVEYRFDRFVKTDDFCLATDRASLVYPFSGMPESLKAGGTAMLFFAAKDHKGLTATALEIIEASEYKYTGNAGDIAEQREQSRMIVGVVNVFAYGFIILISLIAAANVFNTISTNIMLRRREFAMLKSIGMTEKGMKKMLGYECVIYGLRALALGLPVSVGVTFLIHRIVAQQLERSFYMPWQSILIAVGSVFAVVFATMLYARSKIKKDNPIDALKNENL